MNRIDQQKQFTKKPIPAISETALAPSRPEPAPEQGTSNWLSNAMAIWIEQDELPLPLSVLQDASQPAR